MTIPAKTKTLTPTTETTSSNSHRRHHLTAIVFVILVAIMIVSVITGIGFGSIQLSPSDVVKGLFGPSDFQWHRVVWGVRFPRVVLAALVGMNLATSGVILQAVMSNPLADPSIIGVSSGAGLLGIGTLLIFPERANLVPVMAFIGAMLAAMAIYALAWRGGVQPLRIILSGVAVSALCGAGISAVMVLMADNVQGALMFMNGSLAMRSWAEVSLIWPYTVVGIIAAVVLSRRLDIITLGDQVAQGMGMNVQANRLVLTAVAALLAASTVSAIGLLGFVGLFVPHIMRLIVGNRHVILVPACVLAGAALVMLSDTCSRVIFDPFEIPVGIMLTALGVPFFLFLLRKTL